MSIKVEIAPYLAVAIAHNEAAYKKADAYFRLNRAAYVAAARKSGYWDHPLITGGRAEQVIKARRALGVAAGAIDADVSINCLKAGYPDMWKSIRDAYYIELNDVVHARTDGITDTQFIDRISAAMSLCALMGKRIPSSLGNDGLKAALYAYDVNCAKRGNNKDAEKVPLDEARKLLPIDMTSGMTGITDIFGMEPFKGVDMLADIMGVEIGILTDDIKFTDRDRRAILYSADGDTEEAQRLALLALILKAIKQDKEFCMQEYRDDKIADIELAKADAKKARAELKEALIRAEKVQADLDAAMRKIEGLQKEIDSTEGDRQELAALRSALYRAESAEEVREERRFREVPEGVISLGGADTWLNEMRERFPMVKFISPDASFADSDIRGASEVWFQAAYIGHKQFYKAIGIARANNVPVRYFSSTGVGRCAEDLVRID